MQQQFGYITSNWPTDFQFNPRYTFESGQAFRWSECETEAWRGIVSGRLISVDKDSVRVDLHDGSAGLKLAHQYFSVSDNLSHILRTFPEDQFLTSAVNQYKGLRLLSQDPFECIISFICSINSNIPSIRFKIDNLSKRFGIPLRQSNNGFQYHAFPTPISLAKATKEQLISCKVGFRWKYIQFVAKRVSSGELDLGHLRNLSYEDARDVLVSEISGKTFGVGPKVADCVLLFSLGKSEAFPIDVWMLRCILLNYRNLIQDVLQGEQNTQLTKKMYLTIGEIMRRHFGKYAGYAQQYLYMKTRSDAISLKIKRGLERKSIF